MLNAILGAAGLGPTIVALSEGIDLALANKESLVVGGELVTALAEATGAHADPGRLRALRALPADRGRAAGDRRAARADRLGRPVSRPQRPLRRDAARRRSRIRPGRWAARSRSTRATLLNKGLELIEAHHLFGVPYERIDVVVHPQSIVHALVHLNDGSSLAHLGHPDMRVPISYALHHPERADVDVPTLDLASVGELSFEAARRGDLPLPAPRARGGRGGGDRAVPCSTPPTRSPSRPSSAGEIPFTAIAEVVEETLDEVEATAPTHFDDLFAADAEARGARRRAGRARQHGDVSWFLAFAGFAALIILHEFGHFIAAKKTGMRVEKFYLFFPPKLLKRKRGETEYGIGAIPRAAS